MRLTTQLRAGILTKVMKHRFEDTIASLIETEKALAAEVYAKVHPKKILARMEELPPGWLRKNTTISAKFGKSTNTLNFNGRSRMINVLSKYGPRRGEDKYLTMLDKNFGVAVVLDDDDPIVGVYDVYRDAVKDLEERIKTVENETRIALSTFNTRKTLVAAWPEIASFVSEEPKKNLPALPIEVLNESLRLPVDVAA